MNIKFLGIKGTWREIANSARTTIGLEEGNKEPSSLWKRRMLLCEHSPIRQLIIKWKWTDLLWWIQTHFTRHWVGVVWWVKTSRSDRTGIDRNNLTQNALVDVEGEANAQAIINISRKRLCYLASKETRDAWWDVLNEVVLPNEPELYSCCVPDCIYRGHCFEFKSCGFYKTDIYKKWLKEYREGINE